MHSLADFVRKRELGRAEHVVQTSNLRFRDNEFLLPCALTKGLSTIQIRVRFTPESRPLFPGHPISELAWSEMRYTVYSFVMREFMPAAPRDDTRST